MGLIQKTITPACISKGPCGEIGSKDSVSLPTKISLIILAYLEELEVQQRDHVENFNRNETEAEEVISLLK